MSITPVSLLPKLRKILTTDNYEKYNLFERVGLRPFAADIRKLASNRNSWLFRDLIFLADLSVRASTFSLIFMWDEVVQ